MCIRQEFASARPVGNALPLAYLPDRFSGHHRRRDGDVEAAGAVLHRDQQAGIGPVMDMVGYAGGFASEQKRVAFLETEARVDGRRLGRQKQQPASVGIPLLLEGRPVEMTGQSRHFDIVHPSTLQRPVRQVEARRFDEVDAQPKARGEAQDCTGIAGDIRLVEGDAQIVLHFEVLFLRGRSATARSRFWQWLDFRVVVFCDCVYMPAIVNSN